MLEPPLIQNSAIPQQFGQQNQPQPVNGQPSTQPIPSPQSQPSNLPGAAQNPPQKHVLNEEKKPKSGLEILDQESGIFVEEKPNLCCEGKTIYEVFGLDNMAVKKGTMIFKCTGKSGCLAMTCLSGNCRPFKMDISSLNRGEDDVYEPFLALERPCKYTCWCRNRPYVNVTLVSGSNEYIGKIVEPCNCCDIELQIFEKDNNNKYSVGGDCCQVGVLCPLPCKACQIINFNVKSASSGEIISKLQKRTQGCLKAAFSDLDSFALFFPSGSTAYDKALLMCAVLFLDYRHFKGRCD